MSKILEQELTKALEELIDTTTKRDEYRIGYEIEKARMMFSAEVQGLGNQSQRDAQVTVLLDEKGMYRNMAILDAQARIAYYKWSSFRAILEGRKE